MKTNTIILLIYSVLITMGGAMGYLKGGSLISLITGGSCGLILFILTYLSFKQRKRAEYMAIIFIFLLDAFFTYRFAKTLHFFPSGILSLISLLIIVALSINLNSAKLEKLKK